MAQSEKNKTMFNEVSHKPVPEFIHLNERVGEIAAINFQRLTVRVPFEKRVLIENSTVSLKAGDRAGLTGPNGSGKSSLFRVMRGLDSEGCGHVEIALPAGKDVFCASQEIRKAALDLPGLLAYPHDAGKYAIERYEDVLREVGLEQILIHLPWNAVNPDNVMHVIAPVISQGLEAVGGRVERAAAEIFARSFRKALSAHLAMPTPLEAYYTPEIREQLVEAVSGMLAEKLADNEGHNEKPKAKFLFSSRAARRSAKAMAEHIKSAMDGWLLQGHRMRLSGGEQQKMVFARMFLQGDENAVFLLDEVTSALKEVTAHELYGKLIEKFPDALIVGIIHDTSLLKHFTHHMELGTDKSLTIKKLDQAPKMPTLDMEL